MVQVTTTTSWGKRILNSLLGVLIGIILILGAVYLVFWNEGHGLRTAQSLQQAREVVIDVADAPVDANNEMRVIHLSGKATTEDVLDDTLFNVSETAIQLNRHVEMYQWEENESTSTEKNLGGSETETKTYTYKQVWSPNLIKSTGFKEQSGHQNPADMPLKSEVQYAKDVTVGDFSLPVDLITQISGDSVIKLDKVDTKALKAEYDKPVHHQGDTVYLGESANVPHIGDMRVTMHAVFPTVVSIVAQQTGNTLQPYLAPAGEKVNLIEMGQVSSDIMIHNAEVSNRNLTWLLRVVALFVMVIGFAMILKPLSVLADIVPFVGGLVGFGTGLIAWICGLGLWAIVIAVAWFAVRPLWAIGLILLVGGFCYYLYSRKKSQLQVKA